MTTNPRNLVADAERTTEQLVRVTLALPERLQAIVDRCAGQPGAAAYDSPMVSSSGTSDPTSAAALSADSARQDLAEIEQLVARIAGPVTRLQRILAAYDQRTASPSERQLAERDSWPMCESCARVEGDRRGTMRREPAHGAKPVNPKGQLREPKHLCRWCGDFVRDNARLPTTLEVDVHARGGRVMVTTIAVVPAVWSRRPDTVEQHVQALTDRAVKRAEELAS